MNRQEYNEMEKRYNRANWQLLIIVIVVITALVSFITLLKNEKWKQQTTKELIIKPHKENGLHH